VQNLVENNQEREIFKNNITKRVAMSAIFIAVGLFLSYINPFAYFLIFGTKINPFAHFINAITGVLIGLTFSVITALGIAILRYSFGIGTIHAFHGGISGAILVGGISYFLRKRYPKYTEFSALSESIGTVFLGGSIAQIILPIGEIFALEGFLTYWSLFALSSIPGSIIGFLILLVLKKAGITWEDFF
jgi:energy coupling factor transporter S component ThiW